jgi:UDP-N-acetylmuramoyl-L-alanyl-D-glutamate--2,6-diaminopimelate ligase
MGYNSAEFADVIIITEEDYRTEDPVQIAREIGIGIEKNGMRAVSAADLTPNLRRGYVFVQSRDEAITKAIAMAAPGDIILCTGKSHEKSLCRGEQEYDWDEFAAVKRALSSKPKATT